MSQISKLPYLTCNVQTNECPDLPIRVDGKIECARCEADEWFFGESFSLLNGEGS
jgi:hypothetical protein